MVSSLSMAASMDCLLLLNPCCSSVGCVLSKFFCPRCPMKSECCVELGAYQA
jgi:hypothetical protein